MDNNKVATPVVDIKKMRKMAKITSAILKGLAYVVKPGVSLIELDQAAESLLRAYGVQSYNKNYHPKWSKTPYPAILCTSVNNCVAHGIPTAYRLKEGDIINIDIGIIKDGHCGDSALTIPVGKISKKHEDLLRYAKFITYHAIKQIKGGVEVTKIGLETMNLANSLGYKVNWMLNGHGIGNKMHESPSIPFHVATGKQTVDRRVYDVGEIFKKRYGGQKLKAGQIVCIEPMITCGKDQFGERHSDGWSHLTRDGEYSAMFEAMVLVKDDGYEILTDHFNIREITA